MYLLKPAIMIGESIDKAMNQKEENKE
jgi:hypothetical protein